jgi:hypothetical protein
MFHLKDLASHFLSPTLEGYHLFKIHSKRSYCSQVARTSLYCDRITSKMRGSSPQDRLGNSRRNENAVNTHTKHTKP